MFSTRHLSLFAAAFGLVAGSGLCLGQETSMEDMQEMVIDLQRQNQALHRSLAESNESEKAASEQLAKVTTGLEALGKNLLDGGEDRLVQAASDLNIANERLTLIEASAARLASATQDYVRTAVVSDPDARQRVEIALRELDAAQGLRQKPQPDVRNGTLQQSRVVSLDQESGMMVLNIGEGQGARIGMTFRLLRGQLPYGKAILADVRKGVSGAFIETLDEITESPRIGDTAILETQSTEQ